MTFISMIIIIIIVIHRSSEKMKIPICKLDQKITPNMS